MNSMALITLAAGASISLGGWLVAANKVDRPEAHQQTVATTDLYRMFLFSADQYMTQAGLAPAAVPVRVTWDTIRAFKTTPPGARALRMPATWYAVRSGTKWVACTDMDERSISALAQLAPRASASAPAGITSVRLNGSSTPTHVVIATEGASELAALCSTT